MIISPTYRGFVIVLFGEKYIILFRRQYVCDRIANAHTHPFRVQVKTLQLELVTVVYLTFKKSSVLKINTLLGILISVLILNFI